MTSTKKTYMLLAIIGILICFILQGYGVLPRVPKVHSCSKCQYQLTTRTISTPTGVRTIITRDWVGCTSLQNK